MPVDLLNPKTWFGQEQSTTDNTTPEQQPPEVKEQLVTCPVHGDLVTPEVADAHVKAEEERKAKEAADTAAQSTLEEQNKPVEPTQAPITATQPPLEAQQQPFNESVWNKQLDIQNQVKDMWLQNATSNEKHFSRIVPSTYPITKDMITDNPLELQLGGLRVRATSDQEMADLLRFITDNRGFLPTGGTPLGGNGVESVEQYKLSIANEKALDTPERQAYQYWQIQANRAATYNNNETQLAKILDTVNAQRADAGLEDITASQLQGQGAIYAERVKNQSGRLTVSPEEIQTNIDQSYRAYVTDKNHRLPEGWNMNPDKQQEFTLPNGWNIYHGDANTPAYYKDKTGHNYTSQEVIENPDLMKRFGEAITPQMVNQFKQEIKNQPDVVEHLITRIGNTPEVKALLDKTYPELSKNGTVGEYLKAIQKQQEPVQTSIGGTIPPQGQTMPTSLNPLEFAPKGTTQNPNSIEQVIANQFHIQEANQNPISAFSNLMETYVKGWQDFIGTLVGAAKGVSTEKAAQYSTTIPGTVGNNIPFTPTGQPINITLGGALSFITPDVLITLGMTGGLRAATASEHAMPYAVKMLEQGADHITVLDAIKSAIYSGGKKLTEKEAAGVVAKAETILGKDPELARKWADIIVNNGFGTPQATQAMKELLAMPEITIPVTKTIKPGEPYTADMVKQADGNYTKTEMATFHKIREGDPTLPPGHPDRYDINNTTYIRDTAKPLEATTTPPVEAQVAQKAGEAVKPTATAVEGGAKIPEPLPAPSPASGGPLAEPPNLQTINEMWGQGRLPKAKSTSQAWLKLQEQVNDANYGIRRLQSKVEKAVPIEAGGEKDITTLLTRSPGVANAGATRYVMTLNDVAKVAPDVSANDINTVIFANHAKEILTEKGSERVMAGGFTDTSQLVNVLSELATKLGPEKFAQAQQGAEVLRSVYASELKRLIDSGLISKDLGKVLAEKYPWYNPLRYLDDAEKLAIQGKSPKPYSVISSGLKRLTEEGTAKSAQTPLDVAADQLIQNEVRIHKNEVAKAIVKVALDDSSLGVKLGGKVGEANTLSFFDDGVRQTYQVPDWIYREAETLTKIINHPVASIIGALNGISRAAFTTASPPFVVSNMLNDSLVALLRGGILPHETGMALIDSLKGIKNSKVMQSFRLSGGYQQRFFGKDLAKDIIKSGGEVINLGESILKKIYKFIPEAGEAGEQAPRMAYFKKQLNKTLPGWKDMAAEEIAKTPQARVAAKGAVELTINFGRGGYLIKNANPFVIFLNASMEGTKLPFRTLMENPASRWRLAGVGAGVAGLTAYNLSYPEYMDIPDYTRWGSVVVMLPSDEKNAYGEKTPKYLTVIPRTREWSLFLGSTTYAMEQMMADKPKEFGQFASTLAPMLSPIAEVPMPEVIAELVEQGANWDFYRSKHIIPEYSKNLPAEQQTSEWVSPTIEAIANKLNVSPLRLDHAFNGLFGGAGKAAISVPDYIIDLVNGTKTKGIPVVAPVVSRVYQERGGQLFEDYKAKTISKLDELSGVEKQARNIYKTGDKQVLNDFIAQHPEANLKSEVGDKNPITGKTERFWYSDTRRKLNTEINKIAEIDKKAKAISESNLSDIEKQKRIDKLNQEAIDRKKKLLESM